MTQPTSACTQVTQTLRTHTEGTGCVQVAFIRQQKLGFQTLEASEFEELRPLLVKVEQAIGNRDFAAHLQQGNPTDAFFKVCATWAPSQFIHLCMHSQSWNNKSDLGMEGCVALVPLQQH